ncbi:MAG TPA: CocE/NonD family hydrolase, partial [Longimicrobiales bacterium]|nr:CocE/NonD family hydrolase [Longimicrobiales bacterium]
MNACIRRMVLGCVVAATAVTVVVAQRGGAMTQEQRDQRWQRERELQEIAIVERKVMMPMRDGVRLATDIYRPKNASGKVPIVFVKTPYNFNYW